jgi:hypothetical protein
MFIALSVFAVILASAQTATSAQPALVMPLRSQSQGEEQEVLSRSLTIDPDYSTAAFVERRRKAGPSPGEWRFEIRVVDLLTHRTRAERPIVDHEVEAVALACSAKCSTILVFNVDPMVQRGPAITIAVWKPLSDEESYTKYEDWLTEDSPKSHSTFQPTGYSEPAISSDGFKIAYLAVRHYDTGDPDNPNQQHVAVVRDLRSGKFVWAPTPYPAPFECPSMDWSMRFSADGADVLLKIHPDFNDVHFDSGPNAAQSNYIQSPTFEFFKWSLAQNKMTKVGLLPEGCLALSSAGDAFVLERDEAANPPDPRYWRSRAILVVPSGDVGRVGGQAQRTQTALLGCAHRVEVAPPNTQTGVSRIVKVFPGLKRIFALITSQVDGGQDLFIVELSGSGGLS